MFDRKKFFALSVCAWKNRFHRSIVSLHDAIILTFYKFPSSYLKKNSSFPCKSFLKKFNSEGHIREKKVQFLLHKFPHSIKTNSIGFEPYLE